MQKFASKQTFAVLKPDFTVDTLAVTPSLYPDLDRDYDGFKGHVLVSVHMFEESWPAWEKHPAGDEIVLLLAGSAEFLLRVSGREESTVLDRAGEFVVVPQDTWHTARISEPASLLFITPGEDTENGAPDGD